MTQKGDPYAKLFSTLSGIILMSCILSQLNILCNNLIQPYFIKMMTHPLFTIHVTSYDHFGFDQSIVIHTSKRSVSYLE